jgi:hypothetical protein
MRTIPFAFILCLFSLLACEKNEVEVLNTPEIAAACENCVRFDALAVGQVSYYQAVEGESFREAGEPAWRYLDDTLELRVVDQQGEIFVLEESIITAETDEVFRYSVKADKDNITFSRFQEGDLANLINFRTSKSIIFPLDLPEASQAQTRGWYINNNCESNPCYFQIDDFQGIEDASVYLDYGPMAYDGNGYYAIYDPTMLYRMISVGAWTGEGQGWELVR